MRCENVREALLDATADALAGHGESSVARHLRACAACRELAGRIVDETGRLAAELETLEPRMTEEEAVRIANQGRAEAEIQPVGARTRHRRWWTSLPVAAAAAIAALLLTEGPRRPGSVASGDGPSPAPEAAVAPDGAAAEEPLPRLSVDVPEQGRLLVFETSDPSVTVVWFY